MGADFIDVLKQDIAEEQIPVSSTGARESTSDGPTRTIETRTERNGENGGISRIAALTAVEKSRRDIYSSSIRFTNSMHYAIE